MITLISINYFGKSEKAKHILDFFFGYILGTVYIRWEKSKSLCHSHIFSIYCL